MLGPCAKKEVKCFIIKGKRVFTGTNECRNPQAFCPREPGEGYEKCKTICKQVGHAEEVALDAAGKHANGSRAFIQGIGHYCKSCQTKLFAAGVKTLGLMG